MLIPEGPMALRSGQTLHPQAYAWKSIWRRRLKVHLHWSPTVQGTAAAWSLRASCEDRLTVNRIGMMFGSTNNAPCLGHDLRCAVYHQHEFVSLQRNFVLQNAVLRDADAHETRTDCAHSSNYGSPFKTGNDPGHQWTCDEDRPKTRYGEERCPKQQAPDSAPERSCLPPILHAASGVVISDHMLVGVR